MARASISGGAFVVRADLGSDLSNPTVHHAPPKQGSWLALRSRAVRPDRPRRSRPRNLHENSHSLATTANDSIAPRASMPTLALARREFDPADPHLAQPPSPGRAAPDTDRLPDRLDRRTLHDPQPGAPRLNLLHGQCVNPTSAESSMLISMGGRASR